MEGWCFAEVLRIKLLILAALPHLLHREIEEVSPLRVILPDADRPRIVKEIVAYHELWIFLYERRSVEVVGGNSVNFVIDERYQGIGEFLEEHKLGIWNTLFD